MFIATVLFLGIRVSDQAPEVETPVQRAHRLCGSCGLEADEVDQLIGIMRESPVSREGLIELWERTYADADKLEKAQPLCQPCVNAILAVASERQGQ